MWGEVFDPRIEDVLQAMFLHKFIWQNAEAFPHILLRVILGNTPDISEIDQRIQLLFHPLVELQEGSIRNFFPSKQLFSFVRVSLDENWNGSAKVLGNVFSVIFWYPISGSLDNFSFTAVAQLFGHFYLALDILVPVLNFYRVAEFRIFQENLLGSILHQEQLVDFKSLGELIPHCNGMPKHTGIAGRVKGLMFRATSAGQGLSHFLIHISQLIKNNNQFNALLILHQFFQIKLKIWCLLLTEIFEIGCWRTSLGELSIFVRALTMMIKPQWRAEDYKLNKQEQ